jgi:hypothetical protein
VRGRGIDFEHRFNTSRWAEDLLIQALGPEYGLLTVRFGLSIVRPEGELIYGTTGYKEPDLLVYELGDLTTPEKALLATENLEVANRTEFACGQRLEFAFGKALAALEVEFSPYRAKEMKGRDWKPRTVSEWDRRPLKRAMPPTAPNVIVKEEDLPKLAKWEDSTCVPIIVTHLFDQEAFAVKLSTLREFNLEYENKPEDRVKLQVTTGIFKTLQTYDRVDAQGAAEKKWIFRVPPSSAEKIGDLIDIQASAQLGLSASKKYVTHALFSGGRLEVSSEFGALLKRARVRRD